MVHDQVGAASQNCMYCFAALCFALLSVASLALPCSASPAVPCFAFFCLLFLLLCFALLCFVWRHLGLGVSPQCRRLALFCFASLPFFCFAFIAFKAWLLYAKLAPNTLKLCLKIIFFIDFGTVLTPKSVPEEARKRSRAIQKESAEAEAQNPSNGITFWCPNETQLEP